MRNQVGAPYFAFVQLSVKSDYAARAVLALARAYQHQRAVRVEELAKQHGISSNYLVQILITLKSKQIVRSQRGKEGGYLLARPPAEISLGDILRSVHGETFDSPALSDPLCPVELREAWRRLKHDIDEAANRLTFQDLLDASENKGKMYYI